MSMKNRFACLALAVLVSAPLFAGTLTLIQPNGGETYALGETKTIRWTAVDVSQNVRLNLLRGSEVVGTIVSGLAASSGFYHWQVGQLTDGTAPVGGNYFIRVRAIDSAESDQNDGPFSISVAHMPEGKIRPMLKVEQPNGGESWRLGEEHTIRWSSRFLPGKVHLQLYRQEGAGVGTIADNLPASGSYSWKAGEILGGMTVAGQYMIRAVAMDNYTVNDMSDGPFDLQPRLAEVVGPIHHELLVRPDLVACAEKRISVPPGGQGVFHVHVRNRGSGVAKAPFVVSATFLETQRFTIGTDMAPGETRWLGDFAVAADDVGQAERVCQIHVDRDHQVTEGDETNNILKVSFRVNYDSPGIEPITCGDGSPM